MKIEFRQHDWMPGFAAYVEGSAPTGTAFCSLNLGSMLAAIECGDLPREELPYMIADSMMHEVIHALEEWASVEFNEERVEALLEKYRNAAAPSKT